MHETLALLPLVLATSPDPSTPLPSSLSATSPSAPLPWTGPEALGTAAAPSPADNDFRWFWKNGLRLETEDGRYEFRMGGRVQFDAGWFTGDDLESADPMRFALPDGAEFRRARLAVQGDLPDGYHFKTEYDFAGSGNPTFTDLYFGKKDVFGSVDAKAGHFKEPLGLERLTSATHLTFLERAPLDALVPKRNNGLMLSDSFADGNATWAVGLFREGTDDRGFSSEDGGYAATARATWAPVYDDDGRSVVHVGAAASVRDTEGARFRERPETHLLGRFVDTGTIINDDVELFGLEASGVKGSFSAQAELVQASTTGGTEADFSAWYLQGSWFPTGEHRPYQRGSGAFGRVVPRDDCAWEIKARVSSLDLTDGGVVGGELEDVAVGVNCYVSANTRFMLDYVMANVDDASVPVDEAASIFQVRLQTDW